MRPSVPANFCGVDESCIEEHVEPKGNELDTALDIPLPEDSTDVLSPAVISQQMEGLFPVIAFKGISGDDPPSVE